MVRIVASGTKFFLWAQDWCHDFKAAGGWRLAAGGWRLAAGGWRLAAGRQVMIASGICAVRQMKT
jgi:hypothetical protein